ncbi:MAG: hypothetical protein ACRD5R_16410 [Candidatus Acidiferrales bacterium]
MRAASIGGILEMPENEWVELAMNFLVVVCAEWVRKEKVRTLIARGLAPQILSRLEASHA